MDFFCVGDRQCRKFRRLKCKEETYYCMLNERKILGGDQSFTI
jgi:hypothetical protein